jgi:hypothetical protein
MLVSQSATEEPPDLESVVSPAKRLAWQEAILAFGLAYLFFLLLIPHFTKWLTPATGDEPFYLVTAQSIVADFDLDERNNYKQHDYWAFSPSCDELKQPGWGTDWTKPGFVAPGIQPCPAPYDQLSYPLPPHDSKGIIREGMYTKHGIGLSVLIAPAWALGGRWLVMTQIALFAGLIAANIYLLAWEVTGKKKIAWLAWLMLVFAAPIVCYALLIFPATPAALFVLYAWRRLRLAAIERVNACHEDRKPEQVNNGLRLGLIGLCIGLLPWLHSVYLVLSLSLFLYWWWGGRLQREKFSLFPTGINLAGYAAFFAPLLSLGGLFLIYYLYYYGTPLPNTQDHAGFAPLNEIYFGLFGLLFDQKWGLLIYAPLYLIAIAGLIWLPFKVAGKKFTARRRSDFVWLMVTIVPYYLIMASYKQWWGEWCPPARYLMPIIPLMALPLAIALNELSAKARTVFVGLCAVFVAWSWMIAGIFMWYPKVMYHWQDEAPAKLLTWLQTNIQFFNSINLGAIFPSYATLLTVQKDTPFVLTAALWVLGALLILAILLFIAFGGRKKELSS